MLKVGKNAEIHVWDIENLKTLSILQGFHQRGVCTLDFSGKNFKQLLMLKRKYMIIALISNLWYLSIYI